MDHLSAAGSTMPKPRIVDGEEAKEEIAARIVAASAGHINVPDAMRIVKMSTPIRSNDSVRRRVLRRAKKLELEAKDNPTILAAPVQEVATGAGTEQSIPAGQDSGGISSLTGTSSGTTATSTPADIDEVRRNLCTGALATQPAFTSKSGQEESTTNC